MSRIIGNEDLVATAVPAPGGVGYTIECSFTPRGIATFTELVGPTVMPRAGYDWCRFWLQAGQAVTQCDAVLVADNECLGSFSVRDLLTAGATVTTLEPRKFLSKGEAIAIAGRLNL